MPHDASKQDDDTPEEPLVHCASSPPGGNSEAPVREVHPETRSGFSWERHLDESFGASSPVTRSNLYLLALLDIYVMCWQIARQRGLLHRSGAEIKLCICERLDTPMSNPPPALRKWVSEGLKALREQARLDGASLPQRLPLTEGLYELAMNAYNAAFFRRAVALRAVLDPTRPVRKLIYCNVRKFIIDQQRCANSRANNLYHAVANACAAGLRQSLFICRVRAGDHPGSLHAILQLADAVANTTRTLYPLQPHELEAEFVRRPECVAVVRGASQDTKVHHEGLLALMLQTIHPDRAFRPMDIFRALCAIARREKIMPPTEEHCVSLDAEEEGAPILDTLSTPCSTREDLLRDLIQALVRLEEPCIGEPIGVIFRAMRELLIERCDVTGDHVFTRAQALGYPHQRARFFEDFRVAKDRLKEYLDGDWP